MDHPQATQALDAAAHAPVALVTGAAKRVGRAIALELARAGHDVVVHFLSSSGEAEAVAAEIRALGRQAVTVRADLTRPGEIQALFQAVDAAFGRLDVLVNSAAVFRRTPVATLTEEDFDFHVATNLKAPYLCCVEAAPRLRASGRGRIVNITDVAAERPYKSHLPYCISKAGLAMLTRTLAKALAPTVTVNAVAPGTVLFRDDESGPERQRVIARIPLGTIGTPQDVAAAVRYLVESEHVTGVTIAVDGGRALD